MPPNSAPGIPDPIPLRPFASPADLRRQAARRLVPIARQSIAETAAAMRRLRNPGGGYSGPWRHEEVPYLVEPMEMQTERRVKAVVLVAPAQSGKTAGCIENPILHAVAVDPADLLVIQTTDYMARDFSRRRVRKMIDDHPVMLGRLHTGKGGDNILDKTFEGMLLVIGNPTINHLSGRPIPRVFFTDYDRLPLDIDGEGAPFKLGLKRNQTFGSRGMTVAESSPGHAIVNPKWKPSDEAPHEAPPAPGILSLYNDGDRRRWHWPCPQCGEYFEGRFRHLKYDREATPEAAGAAVIMVCPASGCVIPPSARFDMNRAGRWVPEGMRVTPAGELVGEARQSDIASYWLFGPAAAFQAWSEMVTDYMRAEAEYERTGDDAKLKATLNTDQGEAYFPRRLEVDSSFDADELADRAEHGFWRQVPDWAHYLTAAVDVQSNRFEILVRAWGRDLESAVIDRWQIYRNAAEDRPVDPGKFAQDWDLLELEVLARRYPVAGVAGAELGIARIGIDSGGAAGVTAEAYDFFKRIHIRDRRREGRALGPSLLLLKGTGDRRAPRVGKTFPDSRRKDRKAGGRGEIPVWLFNANTLKGELINQLGRKPGPRAIHFAAELRDEQGPPHEFFEQVCAEVPKPDGTFVKLRDRNEALDLLVMSHVTALQAKADRINWDKPPKWVRRDGSNPFFVATPGASAPVADAPAPAEAGVPLEAPAPPRRPKRARRRSGYMQGGGW